MPREWKPITKEVDGEPLQVPDFISAEFHDLWIQDREAGEFQTIAHDEILNKQLYQFFDALLATDNGITVVNDVVANMELHNLDSITFTATKGIGQSSYKIAGESYNTGLINTSMDSLLEKAPIGVDGEHGHYTIERLWMHEFLHAADPMTAIYNYYYRDGAFDEVAFDEKHGMSFIDFHTEFLNTPPEELADFVTKNEHLQDFYKADPERFAEYHAHGVEAAIIMQDYITELQTQQLNREVLTEKEAALLNQIEANPTRLSLLYSEQHTVQRTNAMMTDVFGSTFERGNYAETCTLEEPLKEYLSYEDVTPDEYGTMNATIQCEVDIPASDIER